jgi:selenocysteine lyase/cysteine desulfurase
LAAVEYLADLGRLLAGNDMLSRRAALREMYRDVAIYERELTRRLLAGLADIPAIQVYGITDPARFDERFATVSFTHERFTSAEMAQRLGREGLFAWHGNYYALNLTETLDLEPEGMLRIGLVHYNTFAEVERLIEALHGLH